MPMFLRVVHRYSVYCKTGTTQSHFRFDTPITSIPVHTVLNTWKQKVIISSGLNWLKHNPYYHKNNKPQDLIQLRCAPLHPINQHALGSHGWGQDSHITQLHSKYCFSDKSMWWLPTWVIEMQHQGNLVTGAFCQNGLFGNSKKERQHQCVHCWINHIILLDISLMGLIIYSCQRYLLDCQQTQEPYCFNIVQQPFDPCGRSLNRCAIDYWIHVDHFHNK